MYKLDGQEMNVKKLCRKKNITNHGKDHSDFRLGISSIYHCCFFLDTLLVMSDVDPI